MFILDKYIDLNRNTDDELGTVKELVYQVICISIYNQHWGYSINDYVMFGFFTSELAKREYFCPNTKILVDELSLVQLSYWDAECLFLFKAGALERALDKIDEEANSVSKWK